MNETVVLANGCFWCTEAVFTSLRGVKSVSPGFSGGKTENPSYDEVSTGTTGHAESIKIEFDPKVISFKDILIVFFYTHDPTTKDRQGADRGAQYRSAIFYENEEQKKIAQDIIKELSDGKAYDKPIVTEVVPLKKFYPAEDYHHDYFKKNPENPYCQLVIAPKLEKFEKHFTELLKNKS